MQNKSLRHHHLPIFYLKGFTKESNKFKIYDVEKKRFLKNGKEFSPKSYFFEKYGNTLNFKEIETDFLETQHYGHFDDNIAKLFEKIKSSNSENNFNFYEEDMPAINHFVSLMYWRLPHRKEELEEIIKGNDLNALGFKIIGSKNKKLEEEFKNSEPFLKSYKYYNSLMDTVRGYNCKTPYTIIGSPEKLPYLCSDNPVIFENSYMPKVYEDDYLFPLSGNRLLIKANRRENFPVYLKLMVDTLVYKQAIKYVSCTDERYIEELENNFVRNNFSIDEIKVHIFSKLK